MHPNNTQGMEVSQKNKDIVSFFDTEHTFVMAYKKTEKLASAVYMVTNLFPESEPMRNILRQKISELLSYMVLFRTVGEMAKGDFVNNVKTRVLEVSSFLEVSYRGGLLSEMNFSILNKEFVNLVAILETNSTQQNTPAVNQIKNVFEETGKSSPAVSYLQNTNNFFESKNNNLGVSHVSRMSDNNIKDKLIFSSVKTDSGKKTDRQETIINLIKKKGELSIKDIAEVITDCSEKTIQRELNFLILTGVLKRAGVRRWSKYSMV